VYHTVLEWQYLVCNRLPVSQGFPTLCIEHVHHWNSPAIIQLHGIEHVHHWNSPAIIQLHRIEHVHHWNSPAIIQLHSIEHVHHWNSPAIIQLHRIKHVHHWNSPAIIQLHRIEHVHHWNSPAIIQLHGIEHVHHWKSSNHTVTRHVARHTLWLEFYTHVCYCIFLQTEHRLLFQIQTNKMEKKTAKFC